MDRQAKFSRLFYTIAVIIELNAFANGKWMYKNIMPTIFGIGISPLVQLFTTAILGLFIVRITKFIALKPQYYSFPFSSAL